MEFENVGAHCQQEGCNQKDFLPFRCATCAKSLCLSHRSYVSHSCNGDKMKDMTSIDCPICGKSVKFDKSQDPNAVWTEHYLTMCTQTAPTTTKVTVKCFKPGCNKTLGPSNTFECRKCYQKVCLAHRIPEEHNCVGPIRKEFLERVNQQMTVGNNKHPGAKTEKHSADKFSHGIFMPATKRSSSPHKTHDINSKGAPPPAPPPVHHAPQHAHAHAQPSDSHGVVTCPFCSLPQSSSAELINHILAFHPDDEASGATMPPVPPTAQPAQPRPPVPPQPVPVTHGHASSPAATGAGAPGSGSVALHREVCPLCQARFADPIALVRHFESAHSERSQQTDQQQSHKTGTDCNVS